MKIKSVNLHNFRCFEDEKLYLNEKLTVLIGDNGCGKSSFLEALSIGIGSLFLGIEGANSIGISQKDVRYLSYEKGSTIQRQPQFPTDIECESFPINGTTLQWKRSINYLNGRTTVRDATQIKEYADGLQERIRSGDPNVQLPLVSYYGAGRLWMKKKETRKDLKKKAFSKNKTDFETQINNDSMSCLIGYKDCLDVATNEKLMVKWFSRMTYQQLQDEDVIPELSAVNKAVSYCVERVLPNCKPNSVSFKYMIKLNELVIQYTDNNGDKQIQPMSELSDGYRNTLSMFADIAYRMAVLNPQMLDKCTQTEGIVLIDEVDLHLHPQWQKKIIPDLLTVFPNIQFIVTTHSPQVIASVPKESIVKIQNHHIEAISIETKGKDTNSVLKTFMDVSERPDEIVSALSEIYEFIDVENYSEAEKKLDLLENKLGQDDSECIKLRTIIDIEKA